MGFPEKDSPVGRLKLTVRMLELNEGRQVFGVKKGNFFLISVVLRFPVFDFVFYLGPLAIDRREFEQAPVIGDGQGSLPCCSPWGCKESDITK